MPKSSSIQAYFSSPARSRETSRPNGPQTSSLSDTAAAAVQWMPTLEYEEADLGALVPGPRNLMLVGRVANFYDTARPSKSHKAAQGCLKIMLADDTGVLTVRLWYANTQYRVRLGQLVTLWTVHISRCSDHNSLAPSSAPLFTTIFPEGERNCYLMVHENSDNGTQLRRPFGCRNSRALPGLMTLKNFSDGGYGVEEPKLLVCVKRIGARKQYINRNGTTSELISLDVFDDTADASLTLYDRLCDSASIIEPSKTVLLISNPGWRIEKMAKLFLNANTHISINPDMADARRLRALAQRVMKREHVNPSFPDIDVEGFEEAPVRALYTFADVDSFARTNPSEKLIGYLSVILSQLNIVTPYKRNMLMSSECCGVPLFANKLQEECKQCGEDVALRINPRIIGPLLDETGVISSGKVIFSDEAWQQLLGRTAEQLVHTELEVLRYLEQRLVFLRVTMGFALSMEDEIGRLAVWCVRN